ncbi:hypothetical protein FSP39_021834 [Pinctada imbricata]|uniref:Sulfide:quinone oxidoreductase, mitochondrial n=1 Tax=Pinctada imbricata TaxID=66713 RepID=A0AA89BZ76_PINIB|nr:hypothetical protein FSP39_021834 [Pinctada imbricata]
MAVTGFAPLRSCRNLTFCAISRTFATTTALEQKKYKLVVVGGGAGGCATAAKFSRKLGKGNVAVIEPSEEHYYQPMWTLVGGGIKTLSQSTKSMSKVLPKSCDWIKTRASSFDPDNNTVTTDDGQKIKYDYLVVAIGFHLDYDKIDGAIDALKNDPNVCSNYASWTVEKTYPAIKNFQGGNAIFTFPNTPIKCAGAPQKIMYLAEDAFRRNGVRDKANVIFNTSLGVIFGVKKYANSLLKVIESRGINVNYKRNLVAVDHKNRESIFENLDTGEKEKFEYKLLHITPPMSTPEALRKCTQLVNAAGFVDINKDTLQSTKYKNVFSIGDCSSAPTSKTAAAVAAQVGILKKNLSAVMEGKEPELTYDGYTSCPLITAPNKCILAEFDYDANPLETFPIDQGKERWTMYHLKKDFMPHMYWNLMLT